jgi:ribonuclease P protein component
VTEKTANTLPKAERLCGKKGIESLLAKGKHGSCGAIRYIFSEGNNEGCHRILVSVPKKLFKRAVKRNLLKRRIRESWRKLKHQMHCSGSDILFIYSTKEVLTYLEIYSNIEKIADRLNNVMQKKSADETGKE